MVKKENMLVAISSRIVPMPSARDFPFGGGHFPCSLGSLFFHVVLGEIGDLVGERLDFGSDRQRHFARDADGFFVQLRNPRCRIGAAACRSDRFAANSRDLLGAFRIVCRPRLELLDARAVFGGFGQFQHLVGKTGSSDFSRAAR